MVVNMQLTDMSDDDAKKIDELQAITRIVGSQTEQFARLRRKQKLLVVDLVQREVLSQASAARLAHIQRQTVTSWVNGWPRV